ncbi:MAG TPA: TetR/AcrR family transcriptional regulator [Solirubrobacterales bacterium]|nr:TetR/AcrR family transcriptional regulator [Solirubrobacterales bacterium]
MSPHRAAYMEAMVDLAFEQGYENVTTEAIAARAGGSTADFETLFASKEVCARSLFEEHAAENMRQVRAAFDAEESWPDSLRAAAYAHARWIREHPRTMHFGVLEVLWAGEMATVLRERIISAYVEMIDAGREVAADPDSVPPLAAESIVGAIAQVMARNSTQIEELDPMAVVPEMMYLAVRPYLGEEAARAELSMPPPKS